MRRGHILRPVDPVTLLEIDAERVRFPATCAACDAPAVAAVKLPVTRGVDLIVVSITRSLALLLPVCAGCHRRLVARRIVSWLGALAVALGVPFGLLAVASASATGDALSGPAVAVIVVWFFSALWWLRNRASQSIARWYFPAWIERTDGDLKRLTLGLRRASLARDVSALSGLTTTQAVSHDGAGYREAAAHVPQPYVPPERRPMAWWWLLVFGLATIAGAFEEYADLAARERDHRPASMHALLAAIYQLFGKVGVAAALGAVGVGLIALAIKVRRQQQESAASAALGTAP